MKKITAHIEQLTWLFITFSLLVTLSACKNSNTQKEPTNEEVLIVKNGLALKDNINYALFYKLECDSVIVDLKNLEDCVFYAEERTEMLIEVFNYMIWDYISQNEEFNENLEKSRAACEKYGFTSENRITSDWAIEEPYDAYHLMNDIPDSTWISNNYRGLYEKYILDNKETITP